MLVETYEQTEVDSEGAVECEAEAIALIESLGLAGQQKLLRRNDEGDTTRCPYRKMKADEKFIYDLLCPQRTKLNSYEDSPIPVRVLQVAAHAKDFFQHIQVWHASNADIKDPVLVGINGNEYSGEFFILARWGDVLEPLHILAKQACKIWRGQCAAKCAEIISKVQARQAAAEAAGDEAIVNGDVRIPTFYD